jgi:predicted aspartyl protease
MESAARGARLLNGLLAVLVSISGARGAEATDTLPKGDSAAESALLATPTTLDRVGRIVVPVTINGQGPFRFVVDTGASSSTLSPALAHTLGLDSQATIRLNGITGTAEVPAVTVKSLKAGDLTLTDSVFPVIWAPLMAGADGILGLAGVNSPNLLVDFERNRVVLAHATLSKVRGNLLRIHADRVLGGLLVFDARVGRVAVRAVVDTGAERTLGNLALRDALNARPGMGRLVKTNVYGATNEVVSGEIQQAPTIVIDLLRITDTAVVFGDFHIFSIWGLQEEPALILGMDVLGTVGSLGVDFEHRNVLITPPGASGGGASALTHSTLSAGGRTTR